MRRFIHGTALCFVTGLMFLVPEEVTAYGGPGSVVSGIGALLAAGAALLAAVFGFIWFPLKRLFQALKGDRKTEGEPSDSPE